ncbi:MAG: hypothetical protein A3E01_02930 [Gammaproteobacteria bacterium RIFCSPHIGHO2_12_FULL_63_22]|nr:MAG: hypothetical protein A3E01_02930 [Gammaproteobacteria bacterium RIFCSPHIGHO2_12_FULL_63_22]
MKRRPRLTMMRPRIATIDTRAVKPPPKQASPIYHTTEYECWREGVITRAGGRCEWPGCDRVERRMFADHIKEIADGGALYDAANGQCLCGKHHTIKTNAERAKRHGLVPPTLGARAAAHPRGRG